LFFEKKELFLLNLNNVIGEIMLAEGKKAPAFTLKNQEDEKISLKNFLGKKIILYFYPKDNTPGCTTEACDFRDTIAEFNKVNAIVLGISKDSVKSHKRFHEKQNLNFDLLSDEQTTVIQKYGVWKEKKNYGRTYMGIERTTFIIDENGKIEKIYPKVKVKNHVAEIIEYLKN